jgi:hypothetical protein
MKLFFLKDDSLFKIFKTIEKIPRKKKVTIYIDSHNQFFEHERRGKQIKELIISKEIDAHFVCRSEKMKRYFEKLDLSFEYEQSHPIMRALHLAYLFLFEAKKFHLTVYAKKNYLFYLIFCIEIAVIAWVLYVFSQLVLPSATITITPSYKIEDIVYNFRYYNHSDINYLNQAKQISIPYYTGKVAYKYTMGISVSNIKYFQNPSQWEIEIINTLTTAYSLLPNTKFITDDGILFKTLEAINIPWSQNGKPWRVNVRLQAFESDEWWNVIGQRWNIKKWTRLYIRNLTNSFFLKQIYAEALADFSWWKTRSEWIVTEKDIEILSGRLLKTLYGIKQNVVRQNFTIPDAFLLLYDDLITTRVRNTVIDNNIWQPATTISWYIIAEFSYQYVLREDLLSAIQTYINQRASKNLSLIDIERNTLVLYGKTNAGSQTHIIPTKISVIRSYNFDTDVNQVINQIKNTIVWANIDEAMKILREYPEIASAEISLSPPRYYEIPQIKSRIYLNISQRNKQ